MQALWHGIKLHISFKVENFILISFLVVKLIPIKIMDNFITRFEVNYRKLDSLVNWRIKDLDRDVTWIVTMQIQNLKNWFLSFTLVAIASIFSSSLTACSTTAFQNQSQAPNPNSTTKTDASSEQPTNHDSTMMHHGNGKNHTMATNLGPADANYDLRFIDAMIPHHQGAVNMAKQAQQKSKRPEIQELANEIIKVQNQEISQMKQWRQAWYPSASITPVAYDNKTSKTIPMSKQQVQSMMMNVDLGPSDAEFDLRFINAMIPHHQAAVIMTTDALQKSPRSEIKKLAQNIIDSQSAEINQMKRWRKAWYNQ